MALYLIQTVLDATLALGAKSVHDGAKCVLQPVTGRNRSLIVWNYNPISGIISLHALSPRPLVLSIQGQTCDGEPNIILARQLPNSDPGSAFQQWHSLPGDASVFFSVACSNSVIDNRNRITQPGNPIVLEPYNGSPAQQWVLAPVSQNDIEMAQAMEQD
jgi:hypothetical protein